MYTYVVFRTMIVPPPPTPKITISREIIYVLIRVLNRYFHKLWNNTCICFHQAWWFIWVLLILPSVFIRLDGSSGFYWYSQVFSKENVICLIQLHFNVDPILGPNRLNFHNCQYIIALHIKNTLYYMITIWNDNKLQEARLNLDLWPSYIGWFGLCCLMPFSTIFQLYHGSQFYWWRKPECQEIILDNVGSILVL